MADKIRVNKVRAKNAVVGDRARITDKSGVLILSAEQSDLQAEALRQLREVIDLLPAYADEIDVEEARRTAELAESAIKKKRLRWDKATKYLNATWTAVSDVEVLASAVVAVQSIVQSLIR